MLLTDLPTLRVVDMDVEIGPEQLATLAMNLVPGERIAADLDG
jgi:hypothetical protein